MGLQLAVTHARTMRRYEKSHEALPEAKLERLFLYCLAWSLGGLLAEKERPALDAELRSITSNMPAKCVDQRLCCCPALRL
jgi:dynein heavy chain